MKHTLSLVFDVSLEDHWEFACLALIAFVFRSLQAVMTYKYCHLYSHFKRVLMCAYCSYRCTVEYSLLESDCWSRL